MDIDSQSAYANIEVVKHAKAGSTQIDIYSERLRIQKVIEEYSHDYTQYNIFYPDFFQGQKGPIRHSSRVHLENLFTYLLIGCLCFNHSRG